MKSKKKLQLKDTFVVKRCGKELLVQIKEEEVYKIITNKAFTDDEDSFFKNIGLKRNLILSGRQYTVVVWQNSQKRK